MLTRRHLATVLTVGAIALTGCVPATVAAPTPTEPPPAAAAKPAPSTTAVPVAPPAQPKPAPSTTLPPATTTTSTTAPPLADPVPGFLRTHLAPRTQFTVTYAADLPAELLAELTYAVNSAAELSGLELTLSDDPSTGEHPAIGEIRVEVGSLCSHDGAVGCAVVYGSDRHILATALSVSEVMLGDSRLRSVVLHELGHALGLDHVDTAGFAPQIMGNNGEPLTEYQVGDRAGLAAIGAAAFAAAGASVDGFASAAAVAPASDEGALAEPGVKVLEEHAVDIDGDHN